MRSFHSILIRAACACAVYASFPRLSPAAEIPAVWILQGYGSWTDPASWSNGIVPLRGQTNQYDVTINTGSSSYVQSSLDGDMEVSSLTLGDALYVYDSAGISHRQFQIQNAFHWLSGSLNGSAADYHLYGESIFDGATVKTLTGVCSLTLHSHAVWTAGALTWAGYGQVNIESNALFELNTGGPVGTSATTDSASVSNRGTIRMNAPGQTVVFYGNTDNTGLLDVQSGNLNMNWNFHNSGRIQVAVGSSLIVGRGGQWQPFAWSGGGEIDFVDQQTILSDMVFPCLTRISGSLNGASVTFSNAVWTGGEMDGPGILLVPAGGTLTVPSSGPTLYRNVLNSGALVIAPNAVLGGSPNVALTNAGTGVIHLGAGSWIGTQYNTLGTLLNLGSILKDDGTAGTASFSSSLSNQGLVLSMAGQLSLLGGGTNSGTLEAESSGVLFAQNMSLGDSSSLVGNGSVSLAGGTLRGTISPDLALSLNGETVLGNQLYSVKSLHSSGLLQFPAAWGAEVRESLVLNGSLTGGLLRSLGTAQLSFSGAQLRGGATLDLAGQSAWVTGNLTVQDTNSTFLNRGSLRMLASNTFAVYPAAALVNQGVCSFSSQIGTVDAVISDKLFQWTAGNVLGAPTLEDGPFKISGPVSCSPAGVSAGPGAELVFATLRLTNAPVLLNRSSLEVMTAFVASNTWLVLDGGTVTTPATSWTGAATLSGNGNINANLSLQTLQLTGMPGSNQLSLNGTFSLSGSNPILRVTAVVSNNLPFFPGLSVHGPVSLGGQFNLFAMFSPNHSNFVAGSTTLLKADDAISGSFLNVTNGQMLTLTNGFRCQIFYGSGSPFGADKLVLSNFGSAFDQWRMQRFDPNQLSDPSISGPDADPDYNGFNNIADFVLGMDPGLGTIVIPSVVPGLDGYTRIHLQQRKDIGGLQARIGTSTNLVTWSELTLGSSASWLQLHRTLDLGDRYDYSYLYQGTPPSLFLRVRVTGQP